MERTKVGVVFLYKKEARIVNIQIGSAIHFLDKVRVLYETLPS